MDFFEACEVGRSTVGWSMSRAGEVFADFKKSPRLASHGETRSKRERACRRPRWSSKVHASPAMARRGAKERELVGNCCSSPNSAPCCQARSGGNVKRSASCDLSPLDPSRIRLFAAAISCVQIASSRSNVPVPTNGVASALGESQCDAQRASKHVRRVGC